MTLEEAEIGRTVIYTPFVGCYPSARDIGIITSKNERFVFVCYGADKHTKATNAQDLTYREEV